MASRGQSLTIAYVAWDTSANTGKTGDVGNHTLRWVKDGASSPPGNSPSEVDATNAPGVYKITLSADECSCDVGVLAGKSSTANVAIIPLTVTFEQTANQIADAVLARDVDPGTQLRGEPSHVGLGPLDHRHHLGRMAGKDEMILRVLEGSLALVECVEEPSLCGKADNCPTREVWGAVARAIDTILRSVTLADLMCEPAKLDEVLSSAGA